MEKPAAAVLAGGASRRMGTDKALIEIGGEPMLGRIIRQLRPLFGRIIIVGPEIPAYSFFGVPVRSDLRPGNGSLGGIHTALTVSAAPKVFCMGCDMPFVSSGIVSLLLDLAGGDHDAVIPEIDGELEPLCAVYSKSFLPLAEKCLDAGIRRIKTALAGARTCVVEAENLRDPDPDLLTFFNINTLEDLEKARELARAQLP